MEGYENGQRVQVHSGDGKTLLGNGTYVGEVAVYVVRGEGFIRSAPNAEEIPMGMEHLAEMIPSNPKIILDSGEVVYGCQVWWAPIPEGEEVQ